MIVRPALSSDAEALAEIYGWHALHDFGAFEEAAPTPQEMAARLAAVTAKTLPYVVAQDAGRVRGFAYASPFRPRAAYRYTVEDSVYVAPDSMGRGMGRAMLTEVLAACETLGVRQVMAVIGDSGNQSSIGLHRALGFEHGGVGESLGFKHGRWVDIVWMRKPLDGGASRPPEGRGITLP